MQVIAFINMKGAVGKTTLAVNVAYRLAYLHKKKVLILDSDPQFNVTQYLLEEDAYLEHLNREKGTLQDIFMPRRPGPVRTVPGSSSAVKIEKECLLRIARARSSMRDREGVVWI